MSTPAFTIDVASEQTALPLERRKIQQAVRRVLVDAGMVRAVISVAVVDDASIRRLHARYLGHDCATDALSFVLERGKDFVDGEIIVSAETAAAAAPRFGADPADELLLYVIHGALHLMGFDDATEQARAVMRGEERHYLAMLRNERTRSVGVRAVRPGGRTRRDRSVRRLTAAASGRGSGRKRRMDP